MAAGSKNPASPGRLFVISAPSGAGKTRLIEALLQRRSDARFSISHTTRKQRPDEEDKIDYFFVNRDEFEKLIASGAFLEYAAVFDKYYGTTRAQAESILGQGLDALLEIDWQGAEQVRRLMPEAICIFILPPSRAELERRLKGRGTESEESLQRRLGDSVADMAHWNEFDYVIINDDFERAVAALSEIMDGGGREHAADRPELAAVIRELLARD